MTMHSYMSDLKFINSSPQYYRIFKGENYAGCNKQRTYEFSG